MGNSASRGRQRPRPEQPAQPFAYPPPAQVPGASQVAVRASSRRTSVVFVLTTLSFVDTSAGAVWTPGHQQWSDVWRLAATSAAKFWGTICLTVDSLLYFLFEKGALSTGALLQPPPHLPQPNQSGPPPQELTQTATIRNAVNLKKNTLKLVPLADNPNKFSVHFVFDASSPCRSVTVFLQRTWPRSNPVTSCQVFLW